MLMLVWFWFVVLGFFLNNHLLYICHAVPIMLILLNAHQLAGEAVYLYVVTNHK